MGARYVPSCWSGPVTYSGTFDLMSDVCDSIETTKLNLGGARYRKLNHCTSRGFHFTE